MRWLTIAAAWAAATGAALLVAWRTRAGPTVVAVSTRHGIHAGDIAAFALAWTWAGLATAGIVLRGPERASGRRSRAKPRG